MQEKDTSSGVYEPIIFLNSPINTEDNDIIGISSAIKSIKSAIEQGAAMIGVIADYGTGKSSLTETSSSIYKEYCPICINVWDSLSNDNKVAPVHDDIPSLTKSFLYQLASNSTIYNKNQAFKSYINKKLNRNYGLISFSTKSACQIALLMIAALFYLIYLVLGNTTISSVWYLLQQINMPNAFYVANALVTLAPLSIIITIFCTIKALSDSSLTFSHWKDQAKRSQDINDVFEVYSDIINELSKHKKNRYLVIIEDLDRIADRETVIDFLRELYRFQNLLSNKHRKIITFIVAVRPESLLESKKKQVEPEYSNESTIFDKVFDYSICLKPLHFEDYENIILSIINSENKRRLTIGQYLNCFQKIFEGKFTLRKALNIGKLFIYEKENLNYSLTNKAKLENLIGVKITEKLPSSFNWLLHGENLTIRSLKDRLNQAVSLMVTLKSKEYRSYSSIISFSTCAAVTYLEQTYGILFYKVIENETKLAESLRDSYKHRNMEAPRNEKKRAIISALSFINNINIPKETTVYKQAFIEDFSRMIEDGTIDEDFRMYLYNYPKNSIIRTTDEKDLYKLLLMPNLYYDYANLNEKVNKIINIDAHHNIILDCLKKISDQEVEIFPRVIFDNEYIFSSSINTSKQKALASVSSYANWISSLDDSIALFKKIQLFSSDTRKNFYIEYFSFIRSTFKSYDDSLKLCIRKELINLCDEFILVFRELFVPQKDEQGSIRRDSFNLPMITQEEIEAINNLNIVLDLINVDKLDKNNFIYISRRINTSTINQSEQAKAEIIFFYAIKRQIPSEIIGPAILTFLDTNKLVHSELFSDVMKWIKTTTTSRDVAIDKLTNYLNTIDSDLIPKEDLSSIDELHIYHGLNDLILHRLWENKILVTYLCSMYQGNQLSSLNYADSEACAAICKACSTINEFDEELVIAVRLAILKQDSELAIQYSDLFTSIYPLITHDELILFPRFESALQYIATEIIDDDNAINIIDYVNITERPANDCYSLFKWLIIDGSIDDISTIRKLIESFDYTVVKYKYMSDEQKEEIIPAVDEPMNLSNADNCSEYMILTNSLTTSLEKRLSENQPNGYIKLINQLNQCSSYTLDWINDQDEAFALNTVLTDELLKNQYYIKYIIGKTLWDNTFEYQPDIIPTDEYIKVFEKCDEAMILMKDNNHFIQDLIQRGNFDGLKSSCIKAIHAPRHPFALVRRAFEVLSSAEIEDYLNGFDHLDIRQDSADFLSYLKQNEDARNLLGSFSCRQRARSLLWEPSERSSFTFLMHKRFPSENYRE